MSEGAINQKRRVSEGVFGKMRIVLACGLAALLVLGVYYFFFVQRKYNYLTGRNFRSLAAIGAQFEASLQNRSKLLATLTQEEGLAKSLNDQKTKRHLISEFASGFEDVEVATKFLGVPGQPAFEFRNSGGENWIDVYYTAPKEEGGLSLHGSMKLQTVAEPLFRSLRSRKAFDALLLANAHGGVVYHQGSQDLSVTRLDWLLEKTLRRRTQGKDERNGAPDPRKLLSSSSESYEVELNGRDYRLFVEPIHLPLQGLSGAADEKMVWLVCGLVPKKEFVYKSLAVSSALLSSLLGLLILTGLSWPFLKLFLISKTQRVGLFDVLLLGVCSVLGISIATLFLLDTAFFMDLEETSKQQLETLAATMGKNVQKEIRAAYPVLVKLEEAIAPALERGETKDRVPNLLQERRNLFNPRYPFASTFVFMGPDGKQIYKATVNKEVPPLISVRERNYFKRAHAGDIWDLRALGNVAPAQAAHEPEPFYVEPIIGWTSGTPMAMLSRPVGKALAPDSKKLQPEVSALAIPMVSLVNPVLPPGFKFAVIDDEDENGRVLFHSDPERMLTEDFLIETDQDRRLRSAVLARRSETMSIRYWGEDYLAHTVPVRGLPWTIVALKDLRVLRAVNIDWISTTLAMILLYVGALAGILLLIASIRPSYRADWIWPDSQRHGDYRALSRSYAPLMTGFALAVWGLRGSPELIGLAFTLPALAILMAYLKLQRKPTGRALALGVGSLLLGASAAFLLQAPLDAGAPGWLPWGALLLVSIAFLAASGALATVSGAWRRRKAAPLSDNAEPPARPEGESPAVQPSLPVPSARGARQSWPSVTTSYCLAGALLLLLMAVLPTAGFFKVAWRLHSVSFLRHGQLKLALELKDRAVQARRSAAKVANTPKERTCLVQQRLAAAGDNSALPTFCFLPKNAAGLDVYADAFYETQVHFPAAGKHNPSEECTAEADLAILPEFIEELLPRYSEPAAEMREFLHSSASDCIWYWEKYPVKPPYVQTFHSRDYPGGEIHLSSPVWALSGPGTGTPAGNGVLRSSFVGIFSMPSLLRLLSFAGLLCLVWLLVRFVAKRIFLIDLLEPFWSERAEEGPATIGRNLFLVGRNRNWLEEVKKNRFDWIHFRDLDDPNQDWSACRAALMESDRVILVEGFEYKFRDPEFNQKKLLLLEELVGMQERTIVVTSKISPALLFARNGGNGSSGPNAHTVQRWRTLLSMFTVCEEDLQGILQRVQDSEKIRSEHLKAECGVNPHLLSIAKELDPHVQHLSREQILEEFGERAEGYYQGLWASCSAEEQVVLEHLAEEGLVNEKSRRVLRRLMARGFVRRDPHFRLMNETFRRFVVSSICKGEVLAMEKEAAPSSWDRLRGPLFVGLGLTLAFFLATQQDLLDGMLASITGLTAGLPAIVKLFDFFGNRSDLSRLTGGK